MATEQEILKQINPPVKQRVTFAEHPKLNRQQSLAKGRRVYDPVVYVYIRNEQSKDEFARKATEEDKQNYPEAWARFSTEDEKTPLTLLPAVTPSILRELEDLGVSTMEEVAALTDPDFATVAKQAQTYLLLEEDS